MKAKLELRQSRDFGEIINDTIVFIGQNWKSLFKTYFVFCGFFVFGQTLFGVLYQIKIVHMTQGSIPTGIANSYGRNPYSTFGFELLALLFFVYFNFLSMIVTILSYVTIYNQKGNAVPELNEIWGYYKYYFLRVLWFTILLGLVVFLIATILSLTMTVVVVSGLSNSVVMVFLVILLVFLPLIYVANVLMLFFPIVVVENSGFRYAFSRSFRLVKGKWWATFGVFFVSAIIVYSVYLLINAPFYFIAGGSVALLSYNLSTTMAVIRAILTGAFQVTALIPWIAAAITYFSYIEDKESIGLMERIDSLGTPNEDINAATEDY